MTNNSENTEIVSTEVKSKKIEWKFILFRIFLVLMTMIVPAILIKISERLASIMLIYGPSVGDKQRLLILICIYSSISMLCAFGYYMLFVKEKKLFKGIYERFKFNDERHMATIKYQKFAPKTLSIMAAAVSTLLIIGSISFLLGLPAGYDEMTDRSAKHTAIHESAHSVIAEIEYPGSVINVNMFTVDEFLTVDKLLLQNKILPRGNTFYKISDWQKLMDSEIEKGLRISLAGLAAEELLSEEKESELGASGDLESVMKTVKLIVNNGKSSFGPVQWDVLTPEQQNKAYIDIVIPQYEQVKKMISDHQDKIYKLSKKLEEKKKLTGDEVRKIIQEG